MLKVSELLLEPLTTDDGARRKFMKSIIYYDCGTVKSVELQNQVFIKTSIGDIPTEYIIFYETGKIKRLFPLNGKITGYWTENDEYQLAENFQYDFGLTKINNKIISYYFYESGTLKSITLWPKERFKVNININNQKYEIVCRYGLTLYERNEINEINGIKKYIIKSCEPAFPQTINTTVGDIEAFDPTACGINADNSSLQFHSDGALQSLKTSTNKIIITNKKTGAKYTLAPVIKEDLLDPSKKSILPLKLFFTNNEISIEVNKSKNRFEYREYSFAVEAFTHNSQLGCANCSL